MDLAASIFPENRHQHVSVADRLLYPIRQWLDGFEVRDALVARRLCLLIPASCPFERNIQLFGRHLVRIPPMCKLNPLYEQLVGLRFRSLSFLADVCGEDIAPYC